RTRRGTPEVGNPETPSVPKLGAVGGSGSRAPLRGPGMTGWLPPAGDGEEARRPAMSDDAPGQTLSVYYDGGCPLCRAEIDQYRRCAGAERLAFVDVGRETQALGPDLPRAAALRRFHVRTAEGQLVSGAAAFACLWQTLPGWRWLGRLINWRVLGV